MSAPFVIAGAAGASALWALSKVRGTGRRRTESLEGSSSTGYAEPYSYPSSSTSGISYTEDKGWGSSAGPSTGISDTELRRKLGEDWQVSSRLRSRACLCARLFTPRRVIFSLSCFSQFAYDDRKVEGKWLGGRWSAGPMTEEERRIIEARNRASSAGSLGATEIVEPKVQSQVTEKKTVQTRIY
jgi:hypothetical protein